MKSNYRFFFLSTLSGMLALSTQAQEGRLGRRDPGASRSSGTTVAREPRVQQSPSPSYQGQQQARPQQAERTRPVFTDRSQDRSQAQQAPRPVRTQDAPSRVSPSVQTSSAPATAPTVDRTNRWNNHNNTQQVEPASTTSPSTQVNTNRGISRNGTYPVTNNNVSTARGDRRGYNTGNNNGYNNGYNNNYNHYQGNNYYNNRYYSTRPTVVYNAYNPSWRYNYYPRRNTIVSIFPFSYSTINFGGYDYRYYDGLYYQPYNNAFRVVNPPIGIYINVLPIGYRRIVVRDDPYYYYNGTYYNDYNSSYRVVAPPVGAIVESIPDGYETIVVDGQTYYKVDDVQYKPVVQDNGEIWYEVIKVG